MDVLFKFLADMKILEKAMKNKEDYSTVIDFLGKQYSADPSPDFSYFGFALDSIGYDGNLSFSGLYAMNGAETCSDEDKEDRVPSCPKCGRSVEEDTRKRSVCEWTYNGGCDWWESECGENLTLRRNAGEFIYCPYCGKSISIKEND